MGARSEQPADQAGLSRAVTARLGRPGALIIQALQQADPERHVTVDDPKLVARITGPAFGLESTRIVIAERKRRQRNGR